MFTYMHRPLITLILLVSLLPTIATAQWSSNQPMWLAGARLDGVSRETATGYDFFVTGDIQVASQAGPVSGVLVQVILTGPAGEQIHTEAVTGRDGIAVITASVPGPGNYGSTLYDMHGDGYYYDARQNHVPMPAFVLTPPNGVAAFVENGQIDQVRWFKPGTITSPALLLSSWNVSGLNSGSATAIAVDQAGYIYTGSVYEAWGICVVVKHTWYGVPVSSYPTHAFACPEGDSGMPRLALASNLSNELLVGRNGSGLSIAVDRYNAGGSSIASWSVNVPCENQPYQCFRAVGDIATDAQGRVYVTFVGGSTYTANHQGIKVTSNTGTPLFEIDDRGLEDEQFMFPQGIDIDAEGNVFVYEPQFERVKHLTVVAGAFVINDVWPVQIGYVYDPHSFAVDANGYVYAGAYTDLEVHAGSSGQAPGSLVGWISQQWTPEYSGVAAIDVTP